MVRGCGLEVEAAAKAGAVKAESCVRRLFQAAVKYAMACWGVGSRVCVGSCGFECEL